MKHKLAIWISKQLPDDHPLLWFYILKNNNNVDQADSRLCQ
jgi:hypothetical protein